MVASVAMTIELMVDICDRVDDCDDRDDGDDLRSCNARGEAE